MVDQTKTAADEKNEFINFYKWLSKTKRYLLPFLGPLVLLISSLWKSEYEKTIISILAKFIREHSDIATAILQALFILLVILLPLKEKVFKIPRERLQSDENYWKNDANKQKLIANKSLIQLKNAWMFIWISWLLFYAVLCFKGFPNKQILLNLFNNCNTGAMIICYFFLTEKTVPEEEAKIKRWIIIVAIFIISFTIIEVIYRSNSPGRYCIFSEAPKGKLFTQLSPPSENLSKSPLTGLFPQFILPGDSLFIPTRMQIPKKFDFFSLLYSIFAGIGMALFIGRLNNKYLNPPKSVLIALYIYVGIQTSYSYFASSGTATMLITNIAFILKIIFYLYMAWLFKSGRLIFYFTRFRNLIDNMESEWESFKNIIILPSPQQRGMVASS